MAYRKNIDKQVGETLLGAIWSGAAKGYCAPVQPSTPTGKDWLDRLSLLYRLGWEMCDDVDDAVYAAACADFENAVIAAMKQCDEENVFGNRAENGLLLFAYYADANDDEKPDEAKLLHRSAKALNNEAGYQQITAMHAA